MPPAAAICSSYQRAVIVHLLDRQRAVGNMAVLGRDIDLVEQVLAHEPHVALQLVRLHRVVFVEVERDDVLERQALFAMQAHQFVVHADRRAAGRQTEHAVATFSRTLTNQVGDLFGDRYVGLSRMRKHAHSEFARAAPEDRY